MTKSGCYKIDGQCFDGSCSIHHEGRSTAGGQAGSSNEVVSAGSYKPTGQAGSNGETIFISKTNEVTHKQTTGGNCTNCGIWLGGSYGVNGNGEQSYHECAIKTNEREWEFNIRKDFVKISGVAGEPKDWITLDHDGVQRLIQAIRQLEASTIARCKEEAEQYEKFLENVIHGLEIADGQEYKALRLALKSRLPLSAIFTSINKTI